MNKSLTEATLNNNIDDLRDRMRILQNDRKNNIEVLKASKASNKIEINRLREENKENRQKLAALLRTSLMDGDEDELKQLEKDVTRLRKVHDEVVLDSSRQRKTLDDLLDEARELELHSQRPHMEDNEYTRAIRVLENKLDKAMIKFNEAQSIRRTYEQIVRRLKDERVGFDNQLSAIERSLGAKQRDYEELLILSGDANHAREASLLELDRVRAFYDVERRRRETEFRERHQVVQLRKQMLERLDQREKLRQQLAENDEQLALQAQTQLHLQNALSSQKVEAKNKIDIFEQAFRRIKEATGVSDINEVIMKITSQESTTLNLVQLTRDNHEKLESLNTLKTSLRTHVEEIKYAGVGGGHKRKLVDDQEEKLSVSTQRLERARSKYERLSKAIVAMKAGVGHLQDKLEPVRDEVGGQKIALTDESVAEVLRECEVNLNSVMRKLKAGQDDRRRTMLLAHHDEEREEEEDGKITEGRMRGQQKEEVASTNASYSSKSFAEANDIEGAEFADIVSARPFNQRIDIRFEGGVGEGRGGNNRFLQDDEYALHDGDEDELTREKIKLAAAHTLSIEKKKKRSKQQGGGASRGDNTKFI